VLTDFLGMPITDGDEILGELFLANKRTPGGFTAADQELLRLLAAHAATALVNARLYERSRELSIMAERNRIARELHDAVTQKPGSDRIGEVDRQALGDLLWTPRGGPPPVSPARLVPPRPLPHVRVTAIPRGSRITPASRSCTYSRSRSFSTNVTFFGRRVINSAFHCAIPAR
jgi:hypothetical protein